VQADVHSRSGERFAAWLVGGQAGLAGLYKEGQVGTRVSPWENYGKTIGKGRFNQQKA